MKKSLKRKKKKLKPGKRGLRKLLFCDYPAAPKRRNISYFLASFLISLTVLICCASILIVDKNTSMVGWSEDRVELAFNNTGKAIKVTLAGKSVEIQTQPFQDAEHLARQLKTGYDCVKSPRSRLFDIGCLLMQKPASRFFGTLGNSVAAAVGKVIGGR